MYEYGGTEAKVLISKTRPDFTALITQFHRRSNVEWTVLVLHVNPEKTSNTNQIGQSGRREEDDIRVIFFLIFIIQVIQMLVNQRHRSMMSNHIHTRLFLVILANLIQFVHFFFFIIIDLLFAL